jgi:hypothetical protein
MECQRWHKQYIVDIYCRTKDDNKDIREQIAGEMEIAVGVARTTGLAFIFLLLHRAHAS